MPDCLSGEAGSTPACVAMPVSHSGQLQRSVKPPASPT